MTHSRIFIYVCVHRYPFQTDPQIPNEQLKSRTRSSAAASPRTKADLGRFPEAFNQNRSSDLCIIWSPLRTSTREPPLPVDLHLRDTNKVRDSDAQCLATLPPVAFDPRDRIRNPGVEERACLGYSTRHSN
ncbi:alkylmercury lyase [Striga asiatica]|uniref:Alkylmercury lyase n=1 Tax=Striga asiatica TaxID=4170 RepID=A0A5A7PZU9_STRAF|nr:alkylmercury lyase [Striga asiatica]